MVLYFKGEMMKHIFIFMTMAMLIVGCGGGSSSSSGGGGTPTPPPSSDVDMVISEPYTVYPGDLVSKTSDAAVLRIVHSDFHDESTVVLIEGSATIIRQ